MNLLFEFYYCSRRLFKIEGGVGIKRKEYTLGTVEPIRKLEDLKKIEKILSKNKRDLLFFTIGTNCGLRISDILALNVGDVRGQSFIQIMEKNTGK